MNHPLIYKKNSNLELPKQLSDLKSKYIALKKNI